MTTTTITNKARYEGNGVTDTFAFTGRIFATSDLVVEIILRSDDSLVETLTETTHYTVTINSPESASVTVVSGKIPSSLQDIQIRRSLSQTQTLDLPTGTVFPAVSVENALDKVTTLTQDLSEKLDRTILLDVTSSATAPTIGTLTTDELVSYNGTSIVTSGLSTTELTVLNTIASDITTVAGISANVTTVAGISANVTTVAGISGNVTTVAGISADVTTVAGIDSDITAVAGDATDIGTVAGLSTEIGTLSGISANITTVAGISADVTAVAGDAADIGIVSGISADVTSVSGISSNVTTVAGISGNVTTVAGISADVTSVAGISANVTTVAGISADVTTVAGISANITTVATNIADVNNFANVYRIGSADPATSLDEGDLFYNTTDNALKYYNGSSWNAIEAGLTASDIGVTVQGYDADTVKSDVATSFTAQQNFGTATLTDGANIDWNLATQQVAKVTLGGNRTMNAPTHLVDGGTYALRVIQDGTGSRTITWNAVFKWAGGTAPTLSTGAGDVDILTFISDGTNMYGTFAGDFS